MPKRYVHIVTVGASLLNNALREKQLPTLPPSLQGQLDVENALKKHEINKEKVVEELLTYIRNKGHEASAELSSISEYIQKGKVDTVHLLHTDTEVGEVCANALQRYFWEKGINTKKHRIEGFQTEQEFNEKGLQNLLLKTYDLIKKHEGERVLLNATGGFKPEGTALSLVSFIMRKPVYYRHETFKTTITLPPLPIDWKSEILDQKYRSALQDLIQPNAIEKNEFEKRYGKDVAEAMAEDLLLIKDTGQKYELTPFGKLIYRVAFSHP
ncbi:MAG: putative CRISPR-associated protein [Candidatus Caldarchaeum sp.]